MPTFSNEICTETSPRTVLRDAYTSYRAELRRFFMLQSREPHNVDDLIQDVYEALLRYPPREPIHDPLGYLFRIAWHVVRGANRKLQLERHRYLRCNEGQLESLAEERGSMWVRNEGGEALASSEIDKILAQLPAVCRNALLLQRRDGLSYDQIARELGISVHTVKDYIVKALHHFRTHFPVSDR